MLPIYRLIMVLLFVQTIKPARSLAEIEIDSYLNERRGSDEGVYRFRPYRFVSKEKETRYLKKSKSYGYGYGKGKGKGSHSSKKSKSSKSSSKSWNSSKSSSRSYGKFVHVQSL